MQISKCFTFVAVVVMTFSGCALKPYGASRFDRSTAGSGQCDCFTCRNAQVQAAPMTISTGSDCGCASAPIANDSPEYASPPVHAWPAVTAEEPVAPLKQEPAEIEVQGQVNEPEAIVDLVEAPEVKPFFEAEKESIEPAAEENDFVEAPEVFEPKVTVKEVAVEEVAVAVEPVEVIKVAQNDNRAVILRARPVERHHFSHAYQSTRSAPVRQISVRESVISSANGLRARMESLPTIQVANPPAQAQRVNAQPVSVTKKLTQTAHQPPRQQKQILRLRAISNGGQGASGMIDAKFRKIESQDENVRYGGSNDGENWYYESDSIDASHQINYYVPARTSQTKTQRSADQRNADQAGVDQKGFDQRSSDATFDFDRMESDFFQANETQTTATELQTIER